MKVKSECEVAQSCPTLSIDCSLPGSSVHGIFQVRVLEWGAIAFSEEISSLSHFIDFLYFFALIYEEGSEKAMAPNSSTLTWKIPWTEESARIRSMGLLIVRPD